MPKATRSRRGREIARVHAHAAAIDIGATLHVAALGPDRDPQPVRSFGTLTADLAQSPHSCQVAEHCWDPVGLAIVEYARWFLRLPIVSGQG